jgi:hypothetical protein
MGYSKSQASQMKAALLVIVCNHSHNMTFASNEMWQESMKHGSLCNLRS